MEYTLPALVCVALSLMFFFLQRDMGPALVFACLFLALYGMARGSALRARWPAWRWSCAGFVVGYVIGVPHTVGERVSMWLSPWDNLIHGGDQLAHSLWAFATGGVTGMGTGRGDPQLVPAAHTDLILSALGEEWGFAGRGRGLRALRVHGLARAARIALRARTDYEFFLAAGLAAATALQILLIAGGSLGVLPLSGVVTPFLSYGRTAMLANFAVIGILRGDLEPRPAEPRPQRAVPRAVDASPVGADLRRRRRRRRWPRPAYVQVAAQRRHHGRRARWWCRPMARAAISTIRASRRSCARFPRAPSTTATACRWPPAIGTSSKSIAPITRQLGIDIDRACPRTESRHYPFGGLMFDLLGDLRTRLRWGASNTSFVERDSARRLRGYDDRPTLVDVKNPKTGKMERVMRYDLSRAGAAAAPSLRAQQSRGAPRARPPARRAHVHRRAARSAGRRDSDASSCSRRARTRARRW